jgi:hypothetical protein
MSSFNTTYGVGGADVEAASAGDEVALLQEPQGILESLLTHPRNSKNNQLIKIFLETQLSYCIIKNNFYNENLLLLSLFR